MQGLETVMKLLAVIVIAAPTILVLFLGIPSLLNRKLPERTINKSIQVAIITGLIGAIAILVLMLATGNTQVSIELGHWVELPGYEFSVKLLFDRLSVPFAILSYVLTGTIAAFGTRYLHREPGYNRFFVLYAVFVMGMVLASVADTIEVLFAGWEMVGLSSALLVAFFHDRPAPARNGMRIWNIYRVSDAALLLAAVILHHMTGKGEFDALLGVGGNWPEGHTVLSESQAIPVGLLLLFAAAGKSALVPFSGWLPRAMEGPTPSSAVFYGALSVHLGAFLLLRVSPIIESSVFLSTIVVLVGATTALFAYLCGSVQNDIKSALSYASLTQVGIIVAEIGLGFRYVALVHILGHACLRTLQFVRAPTLLHDYRTLENAVGDRLATPTGGPLSRFLPQSVRVWLYRLALERGYFDAFLNDYLVLPFVLVLELFDRAERWWSGLLSGWATRESDELNPYSGQIEDLP